MTMARESPQRIAFFVYPELTLLDLVGGYDALRRIATMGVDAKVTHQLIGTQAAIVDDSGFRISPDLVYPDLGAFDLLYVPGGLGSRKLVMDDRAIGYLRGWGKSKPLASVCTGSILLGAAGHLDGLAATTHRSAFDELRPLCREVVDQRVVDEGRVVTGGGVSSAIDLGLHLVAKYWGYAAAEKIAHQMEYPLATAQ